MDLPNVDLEHNSEILRNIQALKNSRDYIKISIIEKYGYTPYIIKDMGKYNKTFVEQEFEIFMLMRMATLC